MVIFEPSNVFSLETKGRRKQGHIVAEAKMRPRRKKRFWKISRADFVSSTYVAWGEKTRNHLGNTEETLTLNVSECFLVCVPKQHILKTQNLRLRSKKYLASFLHSCNIMSNIDLKCFCSDVSSFAPALRRFIAAGQFAFPLHLSFDQTLPVKHCSPTLNQSAQFALVGIVLSRGILGSTQGMTFMTQGS